MNKHFIIAVVVLAGSFSTAKLYGIRLAALGMLPYVVGVPEFEYDYDDLDDNFTFIYGLSTPIGVNDGGFGFALTFGTNYYIQRLSEGPYASIKTVFGFVLREDPDDPNYVFAIQSDNIAVVGISGGYRYVFENNIDVSAEAGVFGGKIPFAEGIPLVPAVNLSVGLHF